MTFIFNLEEWENLYKYGFSKDYYININADVYNSAMNKIIKSNKYNIYYLKDNKNNSVSISKKNLYRKVYNKEYCIDNIQSLNGEEWKELKGTKGKYFISSFGRIKSYCRYNAILLKPFETIKNYYTVKINGKVQKVHRLTAMTFIKNDDINYNNSVVHHKDKNRKNNNINNLEWLSAEKHNKIPKGKRKIK